MNYRLSAAALKNVVKMRREDAVFDVCYSERGKGFSDWQAAFTFFPTMDLALDVVMRKGWLGLRWIRTDSKAVCYLVCGQAETCSSGALKDVGWTIRISEWVRLRGRDYFAVGYVGWVVSYSLRVQI